MIDDAFKFCAVAFIRSMIDLSMEVFSLAHLNSSSLHCFADLLTLQVLEYKGMYDH
jgi:hypothetical protein